MAHVDVMLGHRAPISQDRDIWHKARLGSLTASRMEDARAMLKKGGESEVRYKYKIELLTERLTGVAVDHYVSPAMQRGLALEDAAKEAYEIATGDVLGPAVFVKHPRIEWFGATPDSVTVQQLAEFKVPLPHTYVRWMLEANFDPAWLPEEHIDQMIAQQCCTGIRRTVFVAYAPEMPEHLRLFIREFRASNEQIAACEADAVKFLREVEELHEQLKVSV
jgi:predicted phage-related endonuclease